jgi:hypothetical protein
VLLGEETWDRPEPWPRSHKRDDGRDPLLVAAFLIGLPFSKSKWDTVPCLYKHVSYPTPHSKNVWKSRSKNQQESEEVAAIFMRKSRETIVTRYRIAQREGVIDCQAQSLPTCGRQTTRRWCFPAQSSRLCTAGNGHLW